MKRVRKLLLILGLCVGMGLSLAPNSIRAEEQVEEQVVSRGTVVVTKSKGGDLITDITEGNVGDTVTVRVSAYVLYDIESVTVNGTTLIANDDGNYTFQLVEGENKVNATFIVNNEQLKVFAEYVSDVQEGGISSLLTVNNLFKLLSAAWTVFISSGLLITLIKKKKIKSDVISEATATINSVLTDELKVFLKNTILPIMEEYGLDIKELKTVSKTLARCFVLAQEDTPEARLAIIEELTKLSSSDKELADTVKSLVNKEIDEREAKKAETQATLQELKDANESITENTESSDYGQI